MSTIQEITSLITSNLEKLDEARTDIKNALIEKGAPGTDKLSQVSNQIRQITVGGGFWPDYFALV